MDEERPGHIPKGQQTVVAAALRRAFLQPDQEAAQQTWRQVADQLRPPSAASRPRPLWGSDDPPAGGSWPKLAGLMDESEHEVLACMAFPAQHRVKLHSTNPLERLNKEVKRRARACPRAGLWSDPGVVGIFPNEASITRLVGAVLLERNDERQLQHRSMQLEAMSGLTAPADDASTLALPPKAA